MISIDYYAYINKLRKIHPMEKASFAFITLIISLLFDSWLLHLCVITFMMFLTIRKAHIPVKIYVKLMLIPLVFLLLGVLGVALTITTNPETHMLYGFRWGNWLFCITEQGLLQGGSILLRSYAGVSCLYFLTLTTPMVDVIWVLKRIRTPMILTELMTIVYRFIFVIIESAYRIYVSQECRLGYISLKRSYHSLGSLVSNLFLNSLQYSRELYIALSARGYTGDLKVLEEDYQYSRINIAFIIIAEVFFIFIAIQ